MYVEVAMDRVDLRVERTVTVPVRISQLWCQNSQKKFSAELNCIGRNYRLIELTFESLSEKSITSHSSENIRSAKYKIELKE